MKGVFVMGFVELYNTLASGKSIITQVPTVINITKAKGGMVNQPDTTTVDSMRWTKPTKAAAKKREAIEQAKAFATQPERAKQTLSAVELGTSLIAKQVESKRGKMFCKASVTEGMLIMTKDFGSTTENMEAQMFLNEVMEAYGVNLRFSATKQK
jgi:hypothetical protein